MLTESFAMWAWMDVQRLLLTHPKKSRYFSLVPIRDGWDWLWHTQKA